MKKYLTYSINLKRQHKSEVHEFVFFRFSKDEMDLFQIFTERHGKNMRGDLEM